MNIQTVYRTFRFLLKSAIAIAALGLLSGCSTLLYYPTDTLYVYEDRLDPPPVAHSFKISDGTQINGWYFHAEGTPTKGVILQFHGNAQNRTVHFYSLHWLAKEGYDLAIFDYPGYRDTAGEPDPQNTVAMGVAAIKYVRSLNPELPLIVYGQSLGGIIAMRSTWEVRNEVKPDLLIIDSSFLSYQKVAKRVLSRNPLTWLLQPFANVLLSDEWAAKKIIGSFEDQPLLVIHAKDDAVVPFDLGHEIYKKANHPKQLWVRPSGGHVLVYRENQEEGLAMRERLLSVLPGSTTATPKVSQIQN